MEIKNRITDYWTRRAPSFSVQRMRDFHSEKHGLWMEEFQKYIPMDRPLKILDIGTGTGFFAFVLGARGHHATGIDLTQSMIDEARRTSEVLGIPAEFCLMDAEKPEFPPETFDVIVTRNLTWVLPHMAEAYQAWHKLLKPGGILINFDADYCHEDRSAVVLPENHAHKLLPASMTEEDGRIKDELRATQKIRPEWDVELLTEAGFRDITVDHGVWGRIYNQVDEFYNPTPIFMIVAYA